MSSQFTEVSMQGKIFGEMNPGKDRLQVAGVAKD